MNNTLDLYTFFTPFEMRWKDLDPLGHVNNAVFVTYFEISRGPYLVAASPRWKWANNPFLIASIQLDLLHELTLLHKPATAYVRVSKIGTKSFEMEYIISSPDLIHCIGKTTQVMYNTEKKKAEDIPLWLKNDFIAFEKPNSIILK